MAHLGVLCFISIESCETLANPPVQSVTKMASLKKVLSIPKIIYKCQAILMLIVARKIFCRPFDTQRRK